MFAALFSALGGLKGLLSIGTTIAEKIVEAKKNALDAKTESERIAAEERVRTLEMIAATVQQDRYAAIVRGCFTFPYIIYISKLILWDKVLAWGTTDPITTELWSILWIILGYYFVRWLRNGA